MKSYLLKFNGLLLGAAGLLLSCMATSCVNTEPGNNSQQQEDYTEFDFATTKNVQLNIKYATPAKGYRIQFEVYDENPMMVNEDGQVVKRDDVTPKVVRMTDENGSYSGKEVIPGYLDGEVFIYSPSINVPMLYKGTLENGQLSADITWDNEYDIVPAASVPMSRASYTVPEGYLTLGSWNDRGTPDYLETSGQLTLDANLLATINNTLREHGNCPESLKQSIDFEISEDAEVKVRSVGGTSAALSVFGYYCYPAGASADEIKAAKRVIVFPNTKIGDGYGKKGALKGGECVQLHYIDPNGVDKGTVFPAGVKIGWFLLNDGFVNGNITDKVDYKHYSTVALNGNGSTYTAAFSINKFLVLSFEDYTDTDFNDVFFNIWSNPIKAIMPPDIPSVDPIGPSESDVAYSINYKGVLAFEDLWPSQGDYDMNDVVVKYNSRIDFNMYNEALTTVDTFTPLWCGAYYRSGFCYQMNVDKSNVESSVAMDADLNLATFTVFEDVNSVAAGKEPVTITNKFKTPVSNLALGVAPYNPFINVGKGDRNRKEVHPVNYKPTDKADMSLLGTGYDKSHPEKGIYYVSQSLFPFAIHLSDTEEYIYTKEKQRIDTTYPKFSSWVSSKGKNDADWYLHR